MRVPGELNRRTIYDVFQFVQQLDRVSALVPLGETELLVCLFEEMAVEWDRPASKRQSAVGRASINKQPLAPSPFRTVMERSTAVQPQQTKGRLNWAIFRHEYLGLRKLRMTYLLRLNVAGKHARIRVDFFDAI